MYCNSLTATLSLNKLPKLLTALYLHYSELMGFDQHSILRFDSLVVLDVAHCRSFGFISPAAFHQLLNLRVLNLQNTSILSLQDMFFINLVRVQQFNILYNTIPVLHDYAFIGLSEIGELDLHALGVTVIYQNALYGLTSVQTLNLSMNRISTLFLDVFSYLNSMTILDISGNELTSINVGSFVPFQSVVRVNTTKVIECQCYLEDLKLDCHATVNPTYTNCEPLLPSTLIVVIYFCSVLYVLLCSAFNIYLQIRFATPNAQLPLTLLLATHDMLSAIILLFYIAVNFVYTETYPLSRQLIDEWKLCKAVATFLILILVISKQIAVLLSYVHLYVTGTKVMTTPYTIKKILVQVMVLWIGTISASAVWSSYAISYPAASCVPFGAAIFSEDYISWTVIISYLVVSIVLVVIAVIMDSITVSRIKESQTALGAAHRVSRSVGKTFVRRHLLAGVSYLIELTIVIYPMLSPNVDVYLYTLLLPMFFVYKTTLHIALYSGKYIAQEWTQLAKKLRDNLLIYIEAA